MDYPIGTLVTFTYNGVQSHDPFPTVFVIASNYGGQLHGLNLRYMNVEMSALLQNIIFAIMRQAQENPIAQEIARQQQQMRDYEKKKQEFLAKQNSVILSPPNPKSTFGGVSTFNRTQVQVRPATASPPEQLEPPQATLPPELANIVLSPDLLGNPKAFYDQIVKRLFGANAQNVFRRYTVANISNIRILKDVRRTVTVRQRQIGPLPQSPEGHIKSIMRRQRGLEPQQQSKRKALGSQTKGVLQHLDRTLSGIKPPLQSGIKPFLKKK